MSKPGFYSSCNILQEASEKILRQEYNLNSHVLQGSYTDFANSCLWHLVIDIHRHTKPIFTLQLPLSSFEEFQIPHINCSFYSLNSHMPPLDDIIYSICVANNTNSARKVSIVPHAGHVPPKQLHT